MRIRYCIVLESQSHEAFSIERFSRIASVFQEDTARQRAYFDTMEKQEKFESFLTTLMEIKNCDVVTCTQVPYFLTLLLILNMIS